MDIERAQLAEAIKFLMANFGDSQESLAALIGRKQPQFGKRLKGKPDWSYGELITLANHWGIPISTMCQGKAAAAKWLATRLDLVECAPWELNPQPAGQRSAPVQGSFFDDGWDIRESSEPVVIDLRDRVMALAS